MPSATFKSVLALAACALGAVAAQDALAQAPVSVEQQAAAHFATDQIAPEDAVAVPHAQILGAVHTQGALFRPEPADPSYPLNQIGTLATCLAAANGWMQNADLTRIHILRAPLTDSTADIQPEVVNFRNYLERGRREYNAAIYAGDTIYIPERDASDEDTTRVIREIRRYPSYYYPPRPSITIIQPQPPRYHPYPPRPRPPVIITPPPSQQVPPPNQQIPPAPGQQVPPPGQRPRPVQPRPLPSNPSQPRQAVQTGKVQIIRTQPQAEPRTAQPQTGNAQQQRTAQPTPRAPQQRAAQPAQPTPRAVQPQAGSAQQAAQPSAPQQLRQIRQAGPR